MRTCRSVDGLNGSFKVLSRSRAVLELARAWRTIGEPLNPVKHILIVDDDGSVLQFLGRALGGYRVSLARNPDEALTVAANVGALDLLITDYMMPSMTGAELIGRLREQQPTLKILMVTAHDAVLDAEHPAWWVQESHLGKPVKIEELREAVAKLIGLP